MAKGKKEYPSSNDVNKLRNFLKAHGMSSAEANQLVKMSFNMEEIEKGLRGWLKVRPKAK